MYTKISEKTVYNAVNRDGKHSKMFLVHIVCDTVEDMPESLPDWSAGSRCDILENGGSVYELSHSGEWMPIEDHSGTGELEPVTDDELDAMWGAD